MDLLDDNSPLKPSTSCVLKVTAASERHGLTTGARWGLPAKLTKAIDNAIENNNRKAAVKLGWDPAHLEVANFTPEQAAAGSRPD